MADTEVAADRYYLVSGDGKPDPSSGRVPKKLKYAAGGAGEESATAKHMPCYDPSTGALLDRLTYHMHILEMNGDSYRLKQSAANATRIQANEASPSHALRGRKASSATLHSPFSSEKPTSPMFLLVPFHFNLDSRISFEIKSTQNNGETPCK
jgi:hypothetical protein